MSNAGDRSGTPPAEAALATQTMASWAESLASVLESMSGSRPNVEVSASTSAAWDEGLAWWGQRLSILEQPSFWIGAPAESWAALGRLTLSALGVTDATDTDIEATCRDVMAQTSATVASELGRQLGEEITGGDSVPDSRPDTAATSVFKWSLDAGTMSVEGAAVWAKAFLHRCSASATQPGADETSPKEPLPDTGAGVPQFGGRPADCLPRLDLRVRFILGRTPLPLSDVFKLNVGSVIELDHLATEPADVVIHDRVVARGQVVVVNGNYGLKILPPQS